MNASFVICHTFEEKHFEKKSFHEQMIEVEKTTTPLIQKVQQAVRSVIYSALILGFPSVVDVDETRGDKQAPDENKLKADLSKNERARSIYLYDEERSDVPSIKLHNCSGRQNGAGKINSDTSHAPIKKQALSPRYMMCTESSMRRFAEGSLIEAIESKRNTKNASPKNQHRRKAPKSSASRSNNPVDSPQQAPFMTFSKDSLETLVEEPSVPSVNSTALALETLHMSTQTECPEGIQELNLPVVEVGDIELNPMEESHSTRSIKQTSDDLFLDEKLISLEDKDGLNTKAMRERKPCNEKNCQLNAVQLALPQWQNEHTKRTESSLLTRMGSFIILKEIFLVEVFEAFRGGIKVLERRSLGQACSRIMKLEWDDTHVNLYKNGSAKGFLMAQPRTSIRIRDLDHIYIRSAPRNPRSLPFLRKHQQVFSPSIEQSQVLELVEYTNKINSYVIPSPQLAHDIHLIIRKLMKMAHSDH